MMIRSDDAMNVLIVDDSKNARKFYGLLLECCGYTVIHSVGNGLDALNILSESPNCADVIILDYQMPVMNGFEFLRALKGSSLPPYDIIFITGDARMREDILSLGIEYFLTKPIDADELLGSLKRIKKGMKIGNAEIFHSP